MLSDENKRNMLRSALASQYGLEKTSPIPKAVKVEEVFDDRIIYDVDGQLYEATYTIEGDQATFGEPRKVASTRIFTREAMSFENRRSLLSAALQERLQLGPDRFVWVEDLTEDEVFYNHDGKTFKATYAISEGGAVTVGQGSEVTRVVTYQTLESLQTVYANIIQEAGQRDALQDPKVRATLARCQGLLAATTEPGSKVIEGALGLATSTLAWLKQQDMTKLEEGVRYPAGAFAYVPDVGKPSGWQLRLWDGTLQEVTKAQLDRAASYLSPGGRSGAKALIPGVALMAVRRTIREAYRKLNVPDADISKWVKETETRELMLSYVPLTEATIDKGRAKVIVIKPGFNVTEDRYYPAAMLKRDFGVFEGQKMYADHPTEAEDQARPERSIKDWVATLVDVTVDEAGVVTGVAEIVEPWLMTKLASLREKDMLSEMGISINAVGTASKDTIDGKETLVIEKLVACRSVDFVTEPGAGGEVTLYESDRQRDLDLVELSGLRDRRPDLVQMIEAAVKADLQQEGKTIMSMEERIKELEGNNATLTTERDGFKTQVEEAAQEKMKAEAQATIKEAVEQAELPQAAKDHLMALHAADVSADGIKEAIQAEVDYIAKLAESGKVKDMGPSGTKTDEEATAALRESMKALNPDWSEDRINTAVRGR